MPRAKMAATLSVADEIRLGSWRLGIAGEARPGTRHDGAGVLRSNGARHEVSLTRGWLELGD